jgi:hypothetical protein
VGGRGTIEVTRSYGFAPSASLQDSLRSAPQFLEAELELIEKLAAAVKSDEDAEQQRRACDPGELRPQRKEARPHLQRWGQKADTRPSIGVG